MGSCRRRSANSLADYFTGKATRRADARRRRGATTRRRRRKPASSSSRGWATDGRRAVKRGAARHRETACEPGGRDEDTHVPRVRRALVAMMSSSSRCRWSASSCRASRTPSRSTARRYVERCTPGFPNQICTQGEPNLGRLSIARRQPVTRTRFVGLDNYRALLRPDAVAAAFATGGRRLRSTLSIDFYQALRFTLTFTFITLPFVIGIGLALALALKATVRRSAGP